MWGFIQENSAVLSMVAGAVAAYFGAYNAIKVDLAIAMERAGAAKDAADSAHSRIDSILQAK